MNTGERFSCEAERSYLERHGRAKHARTARLIDLCQILDARTPCGPGYGPYDDAPLACDVDGRCGRHARVTLVAERYVRLQDRARGVVR